jgi:hypothetical protein
MQIRCDATLHQARLAVEAVQLRRS